MEQNENIEKTGVTIDFVRILKVVWRLAWVVVLVAVVFGSFGYAYSSFVVEPDYSSSVLVYVNVDKNWAASSGITTSDILVSQSLVKTYAEILKNRTTLEMIAEEADCGYTYNQLDGMITAKAANDTEVMKITVIAKDPEKAAIVANTVADVLPKRISQIIDGASMKVVDSAVVNRRPISPNVAGETLKYAAIGFLLSVLVIALFEIFDDTVHDEDYILKNYKYPVLAKIPNLLGSESKQYGYKKGQYYYTTPASKGHAEK